MNKTSLHSLRHPALLFALAAIAIAGCQTAPPPPPPAPPVVAPPPEPTPPPAPEISPAEAKAQAQKMAMASVDMLQNGDENSARITLEKATALDPSNDLARKLLDQIKADPQKELGTTFFRYTVQRDDSLSKLAQTYLGDRFRFYILAKYNDIANPSRLGAGQVIKIPGKGPIAPPVAARPAAKPAEAAEPAGAPAAAAAPEPETPTQSAALMQKAAAQSKSGDLAGAYASYSEAARSDPGNKDAVLQRDATKQALIRRYDREATQFYQRQKLDEAIAKYDQILELDPANQKAKLERERAVDLKKRMTEKFGTKG
jgi:Tfp pilus assembly protein PilF